jgi:hypothetical protein
MCRNREGHGGLNLIERGRAEVIYLDIDKMLAELRVEREQIEEAILTLERLARGRGRRRGRPPSWLKEAASSVSDMDGSQLPNGAAGHAAEPRRRGRPPGSKKQVALPAEA